MSASTPQKSTILDNYSFAHNPSTPQSNQYNRGVGFGSGPPGMGSNECAFQTLGPISCSSPASLRHVATMSDTHAVIPMMENPNVAPWMSDSLSSKNVTSRGSPHNPRTPHDLGGARSGTSSHPATGRVYLSPHAFPTPGPIDHTSVSSQRSMTASDAHSIVRMMANPNAASRTLDNLKTAVSHGCSQSVPYLHGLGGARSGTTSYPAMGRVYLSSHAFPTSGPVGHTSPVSSQRGMTASDTHNVVPMMANPNAVSWTPGNLRTAVSQGPSQCVPYLHDIGGGRSISQLPSTQSETPINQPSPLLCWWVHNNARCGHEGTLEDLKQHWHDSHLPECPGAMIQCQWECCDYHKRGNPSINVMLRSSVWRHISEVHLMHRRH
ncbi:hypothetical protein EDB19DRAFT_146804 [Suillus lakei]|nr:hypothetical protein EDB19DRAFT_146804 [Suillus lakei]